ncbi:uncharacterized protein lost isoform X2 [Planococcus citri]
MDSSPPKVARSPSNKSITPPAKSPTKGSLSCAIKPTLDKSNSQGDIAVPSSLKNAVTGIVPLDNEVTNTAEAKPTETVLESDTQAAESTVESEPKTDEVAANGATCSAVGDASSSDSANATKIEQTLDQQQIAISEQKHAAGDGAPSLNEKIDEVESAGDSAVSSETKQSDKLENYENFSQHLPSSGVTLTVVKKETPDVDATDAAKATGTDEVKTESNDDAKQDKPDKEPTKDGASTPKQSPNTSTSDYTNMSAETIDAAKLAEVSETNDENIVPEISKQSYRQKVWDQLEKDDLVLFPRPCNGRIPNFKGAHQAAEKLASSKVFKNCKNIKVNPDKAQEMVRFHTLEHGKRLLVPIPRLREGLFQAVVPPMDASKYQLQQASQRFGMKKWGKPVNDEKEVTIDMVVLGSVAVDKKGHRIGKGEGYADLEFAMLTKMNAINENTVIVTTVHDDQVFDDLPAELFKEHDVPVDWIVTPTQIIQVAEPLERPKQVIWSILSNRRVLEMPILQKLREQETSEGIECTLKEADSDVEEKTYPVQESVFKKRFQHRRRRFNNYSRSTGDPIRDSKLAQANIPPPSTPHGAPASMPYYNNNNRQQRRYSPNNNRMRDYNHDGRRYDGGVQQPNRRNYYQNAPPPPQYGMQHQQHQQYNGRQPMRQDGQNRNMNRNGPMMNGPRNMNRSAQNGPRMGRQRSDNRPPNNAMTKSVEVQTVDKNRTSRPFVKRKRAPIEFSLRVKNIGTGVRVRDLKTALNERGIKPRVITWKGHRGFAFLHFVKSASNENKPLAVEDVIHALEGLPLPPKNKRNLVIEPAKPKNSASESSGGVEESPTNTTITLETSIPKEPPVLNAAVPPTINQPIAV